VEVGFRPTAGTKITAFLLCISISDLGCSSKLSA